jgi:hypothetical protein
MAWVRMLPNPESSPIKSTGVPGLYCNNAAAPQAGKGIGTKTRRTPETKAKWRAQRNTNLQARALLNQDKGRIGETEYHSRLFAINNGHT